MAAHRRQPGVARRKPHWSAKAEWLYLDLADRNYSVTNGASNGLSADLLRLGVNYHF